MLCQRMNRFIRSGLLGFALCCFTLTTAAQVPPQVEQWFHRAMKRMDKGDHAGALDAYDEALAAFTCPAHSDCAGQVRMLDPRVANILNNRAAAHYLRGDYEAALNDLNRALALMPRLAPAWQNRGNTLRELGRLDDALKAYSRSLEIDASNARAWFGRAVAHTDRRDWAAALHDFDQAIARNKKFYEAWNGRGIALHGLHRFDEALAAFATALKLNPKSAAAFSNRGNVWREQGDLAQALRDHDHAVKLDPLSPGNWNNRGNLRLQMGDAVGAESDYTQALALKADALIYHNRAIAYEAQKQWQAALADYDAALAFQPHSPAVIKARQALINRMRKENLSPAFLGKKYGEAEADLRLVN